MTEGKVLDISWGSILKIAVAALVFYILFLIKDILIWIVFAVIICILFNPAIDFLGKFISRVLAAILVYITIFGILAAMIYLIAPIFFTEVKAFSRLLPEYFETISPTLKALGIKTIETPGAFTQLLEDNLAKISTNIFTAVGAIFGGLFSTITIFTIALFLSLEEKGLERVIKILTPRRYEGIVLSLWERSQKKVSGWFGTRILCSLFVGVMTFVTCYYVLNINYAVSFALFSGVFNFIPIVGPLVSGAIIAIIVAMDSWVKAAAFIIAIILIQQVEGNVLSPVLTKKMINLPPALVLIAVVVGGKLWGVMGALLAIPIAGILFEFLRDFLKKKKEEKAVTV